MNVTFPTLLVLRQFLLADDPLCGAEILKALKLGSGTLYPMLARLKRAGWIEHHETLTHPTQPPAHFYRITPLGHVQFLEMLSRLTIPLDLWRLPAKTKA